MPKESFCMASFQVIRLTDALSMLQAPSIKNGCHNPCKFFSSSEQHNAKEQLQLALTKRKQPNIFHARKSCSPCQTALAEHVPETTQEVFTRLTCAQDEVSERGKATKCACQSSTSSHPQTRGVQANLICLSHSTCLCESMQGLVSQPALRHALQVPAGASQEP
eukprot:1155900-Pelagomonas_calceolata.AAC.4